MTVPGRETISEPKFSSEWAWPFWPAVPLYPYGQRRTLRFEIVKDWVWSFEQLQGILHVIVPIRMTVVRLATGGLLVYAPVAPTPECLRWVRELVQEYGDVKYIILPTVSGIEHKIFVGPFARRFAHAEVFVAPHQWSFPINLPLSWLGLPSRRTQVLPEDSSSTPFFDDFDYAILGPISLGLGPFVEVAFFHKRSRTLLLTDTIVSIPDEPPEIVQLQPYALLFHARDSASEPLLDIPQQRRKGWHRIALFSFYFRPGALEDVNVWGTVRNAFRASDRSRRAYFGLFPFQWRSDWERSFELLRQDGNLLVAPVLQRLILNRGPQETLAWVERVAQWDFYRIIPCHLDSPLAAGPEAFRCAFNFLSTPQSLPAEDFELLGQLGDILERSGITPATHTTTNRDSDGA
ncbi:MAG: DUF4336 domain-containing protein [Cyanobacteria bacterium P01_D01_bin.123]